MNIGNNDGLTRNERMDTINNYSSVISENKDIVNSEIQKIIDSTQDNIFNKTAIIRLLEIEESIFPEVSNSLANQITNINNESDTIIDQTTSTVTITSTNYYNNLKASSIASRDAIEAILLQQIADFITAGTPATPTKELSMYQEAYNTPTASSTAQCKLFYYENLVRTGLLVPWATTTSLDGCYILYKNYKILEALQVESNINIIGHQNNLASAGATLNGTSLNTLNLAYSGNYYTESPEILFLKGGGGTGAVATNTITKSITNIVLNTPGRGYQFPPRLIFTGGGGTDASAETQIDFAGKVSKIIITNPGSGYTSPPTITFSGLPITEASATAFIGNGEVSSITLEEQGSGFTSIPTVKFIGGGSQATAGGISSSNTISELHTINNGIGYVKPPDVVIVSQSTQANASVASIEDGVIRSININNGGSGYQRSTTSIAITGGNGTASASLEITDGVITSITVTNGGSNYQIATTSILILDVSGSGSGALTTPIIKNGVIKTITVNDGGSGYTSTPSVYIYGTGMLATAEANLVNNSVDNITITDGGYGYTGSPVILIGQGNGASATTTLLNESVNNINVITSGSGGYPLPIVSFSDSTGSGAKAIAKVTISSITEVKIITGGSGYSQNTTCSITGSVSFNNASTNVIVSNGVITSVEVINGGKNYQYPSLALGKIAYKDYKIRETLGYPSSINGAISSDQFYVKSINNRMGYPNELTIESMENQWILTYKTILKSNPNLIIMPVDEQELLYINALNPGSTTVNNAKNAYYQRRMVELIDSVTIKKPLSHPRDRRDMDIVEQKGIHKIPKIKLEEKQFVSTTKKNQTTAIVTSQSNRKDVNGFLNEVANVRKENKDRVEQNIQNINNEVSFNYRYVDGKRGIDVLSPTYDTVANLNYNTIYNSNNSTLISQANSIWDNSQILADAEILNLTTKNTTKYGSIADNLFTTIDGEVDAIIDSYNNNVSKYQSIVDTKVAKVDSDIVIIKDQVRAEIRQYNLQQPVVQVVSDKGSGAVIEPIVLTGGQGYTNATVSITGDGSSATAIAYIYNNSILNVDITDRGSGYTSASATIIGDGNGAFINPTISNGIITAIALTNGGYNYTRALVNVVDGGSGAILQPTLTGRSIMSITIINPGKGYKNPVIKITDPSGPGVNATATATVSSGEITSITMTNVGSYYIDPIIEITDGGNGAIVLANIDDTTKKITSLTVVSGGTDYSANPTIEIDGDGFNAVAGAVTILDGAITSISVEEGAVTGYTVKDGGSGYFSTPSITVVGNGKGASGTATITNGVIISVAVSTRGSGYHVLQYNSTELMNNAFVYATQNYNSNELFPSIGVNFKEPYWTYLDNINPIPLPTGLASENNYREFRIKQSMGYPNAPNSSTAIDNYIDYNMKNDFGYPNASTVSDAGNLAKEDRKRSELKFPNVGTSIIAKNLYIAQYTNIDLGYPNYVTNIKITNGGSGYTSVPAVEIVGGGSGGATATCTINVIGAVDTITLISGGSGYQDTVQVEFIGGGSGGSGATVVAEVNSDGEIIGFNSLSGGTGYTSPPIIRFKNFKEPERATAVASINHKGEVDSIEVLTQGGYYSSQPQVIFHGGGGGSGAIAETNYIAPSLDNATNTYKLRKGVEAFSAPEGSNEVSAKEYYRVKEFSYLYNLPYLTSLSEIETTYKDLVYSNLFYPSATASPKLVDEIVPEDFLNRLDRSLFPNDTMRSSAEILYLYNIMESWKTSVPPSFNQEEIDQLYRTAFGYPPGSTIVFGGEGYVQDPIVTIVPAIGDAGIGAKVFPIVSEGVIIDIIISNGGSNYNLTPNVLISGSGRGATATATINNFKQVSSITITSGGSGYMQFPYAIIGGGRNETDASAVISQMGEDGQLINISILDAGTGYIAPPTISFKGRIRSDYISATATATLNGDKIDSINLTYSGIGYLEPPRIVITRNDDATAELEVENGKISNVILTSQGNNYTSIPTLTIYGNYGRGARADLKLNSIGTVSTYISVNDAIEGYRQEQNDNTFDTLTISSDLSKQNSKGLGNMSIQTQRFTHYERVYGPSPEPTKTTESFMTLSKSESFQLNPIKERIVPNNMSISSKNNIITRKERLNRSYTYLTLYRQAEALVKVIVLNGAKQTPPIYYNKEQQRELLYQELNKIPSKVTPFSEIGIVPAPTFDNSTGFGIISNNNSKKIITTHEDRIEYNLQQSVLMKNIIISISELERNRGGSITATLTNNGGNNYMNPVVSISSPDASITPASANATISNGNVIAINVTSNGSGYPTVPTISFIGGGGGNGAEALALLSNTGILEIRVTSQGSGYTSPPTVVIQDTLVQATATAKSVFGTITEITVTNVGWGYVNPTIEIDTNNQPGSGATLDFTLTDSTVSEIFINNTVNSLSVTDSGRNFNPDYPPSIVFESSVSQRSAIASVPIINRQLGIPNLINGGSRYSSVPKISLIVSPLERSEIIRNYTKTKTDDNDTILINESNQISRIKSIIKSALGTTVANARINAIRAYIILTTTPSPTPPTLLASHTNGVIDSVQVISGGSGYIPGINYSTTISNSQGQGLELSVSVDLDGSIKAVSVINGGVGYFNLPTITVDSPDTKNNFDIIMNKAVVLTNELKLSTGISLEPPLSGAWVY